MHATTAEDELSRVWWISLFIYFSLQFHVIQLLVVVVVIIANNMKKNNKNNINVSNDVKDSLISGPFLVVTKRHFEFVSSH